MLFLGLLFTNKRLNLQWSSVVQGSIVDRNLYEVNNFLAGLWASALSVAESYPMSKVRNSIPESQAVMVQEWPGGATQCLRPVVARRRHPMSEVRGGWEKPPRAQGQGW